MVTLSYLLPGVYIILGSREVAVRWQTTGCRVSCNDPFPRISRIRHLRSIPLRNSQLPPSPVFSSTNTGKTLKSGFCCCIFTSLLSFHIELIQRKRTLDSDIFCCVDFEIIYNCFADFYFNWFTKNRNCPTNPLYISIIQSKVNVFCRFKHKLN